MLLEVDYLGEGRSDEAVARALIRAAGHTPGRSYLRPRQGTGKESLGRRLPGLNRGAPFGRPILVLRELDHDAPCAGALVAALLPQRHAGLLLRIAVREVEAWLLADREVYARFSGVAASRIPREPETLDDPKRAILGLADAAPRSKLARHLAGSRARQLPDWQSLGEWHADFAETAWSPLQAISSGSAPSLTAALQRLRALNGTV